MKYSDINYKYFILYAVIIGISLLLVNYQVFEISEKVITFIAVAVCYLIFYVQKNHSKKTRVLDLEEYSQKENYDFVKDPSASQTDEFRGFKTLAMIMDENQESFLNLLIQKSRHDFNHVTKPKIVTVKKTEKTFDAPDKIFYTQVYHFKTNKSIPLFYLADIRYFSYFGRTIAKKLPYKKINIEKYNFPKTRYELYSNDDSVREFFNKDFIGLLNLGAQKKKRVNIESDGENIIFYVLNQRHSAEGINFYTNLFETLFKALVKN